MPETMNNEATMETVKNTVEIIPAATQKVDWKKFGVGALIVGAVGALAAGAYFIYSKVANKGEQDGTVDNVKVAQHDFVEEDESEE